MQQMNSDDSFQNQQSYGRYEGDQAYRQQSETYGPAMPMYDDDFIDALAQRLSQRMIQGPSGKIQPGGKRPSAGQRLALAIVSLSLLTFIAMIGIGNSLPGSSLLLILGIIALAAILINAFFNRE